MIKSQMSAAIEAEVAQREQLAQVQNLLVKSLEADNFDDLSAQSWWTFNDLHML